MRRQLLSAITIRTSERFPANCAMDRRSSISSASATTGATMATMTAFAGKQPALQEGDVIRNTLRDSIERLVLWLRRNDYQGYDTFDGLGARYVRPLTFET